MYKSYVVIVVLLFCMISASAIAAPKPLAYYPFDELGNVVKDASGNGNDGTPKGDIKLNDNGKLGKCFEFNGVNSYVDIQRTVQDDFTLMAWIKTDKPGIQVGNQGYQGSGLIWSDVGGVANDFILALLGTKLSFFCGNPDLSVNSDKDIVTGDWVHVAGVRSQKNQKISIFINGKHEKTIDHTNKGSLNAQPRIHIGGNTLDSRYYAGFMDEVKIFDSALSEQEISESLSVVSVEASDKLSILWGSIKSGSLSIFK